MSRFLTDAQSLRNALIRAQSGQQLKAKLLIAPLVVFLFVVYVLPLAEVLRRSVDDRDFSRLMPQTARALDDWDRKNLPPPMSMRSWPVKCASGPKPARLLWSHGD